MTHRILAGLGYGDEGKGSITDFLCSPHAADPARAVVRYNGGSQAGHNVVTEDGRQHCFSQFGAGTLQGARTHLSRYMMTDPLTLAAEADHLQETGVRNPYAMLTVDPGALLITPWHVAANRARERARGTGRHGSCGMGIGETAGYALGHPDAAPRFGDLLDPGALRDKLGALADYLHAALPGILRPGPYRDLAARLPGPGLRETAAMVTAPDRDILPGLLAAAPVVFEGAQGILLDQRHGSAPYVTWSDTTFANAETLLRECGATAIRTGVTRTYMTRHGAGPFPSEDPGLDLPEPHNVTGPWQGPVRQGHLDLAALRYALAAAGGADEIALTHADTAERCGRLRAWRGPAPEDWPGYVAGALGVPVAIVSRGPSAAAKTVTRLAGSAGLP